MITLDEKGRAIITGTRYRISMLAAEHLGYRWSVEDLKANHPDLSETEINAALAYFYEHRVEIESEIDETEKEWHEGKAASSISKDEDLDKYRK